MITKETLQDIRKVYGEHPAKDIAKASLLEFDIAHDLAGIIHMVDDNTSIEECECDYQPGIAADVFIEMFVGSPIPTLPELARVAILEWDSLEAYTKIGVDKAYYAHSTEDRERVDPIYPEGITYYPIEVSPQHLPQIAVQATDRNIAMLPQAVRDTLPEVERLHYVRYNEDLTTVMYEEYFTITDAPEEYHALIRIVSAVFDVHTLLIKRTPDSAVRKIYLGITM